MNFTMVTFPNPQRRDYLSVILAPRYSYRPVWSRRDHRTVWVTRSPEPLRPEHEHPRAVGGVGGRRHRKRRRAEARAEVKAWKRNRVREMAAMPKDDLPF